MGLLKIVQITTKAVIVCVTSACVFYSSFVEYISERIEKGTLGEFTGHHRLQWSLAKMLMFSSYFQLTHTWLSKMQASMGAALAPVSDFPSFFSVDSSLFKVSNIQAN